MIIYKFLTLRYAGYINDDEYAELLRYLMSFITDDSVMNMVIAFVIFN